MYESFPNPMPHLELALRLLTALGCGIVIGLNRDFHGKPAGARTFGLVGVGSAVVVIVILQAVDTGAVALSRVIQGVVTGIGFLGAGVIFQRDSPTEVYGLTTAAAVWLTAGLGMAAGAGQYVIALFGLVFAMVLLLLGRRLENLVGRLLGRRRPRALSKKGPPVR
jgi:putative Mg2+ transporter-C (MgtC) family protein